MYRDEMCPGPVAADSRPRRELGSAHRAPAPPTPSTRVVCRFFTSEETRRGGGVTSVQTLNADSPGLTFIAGTHRNAAPGVGGAIGSASGSSHVTATTRTSLSPRNSRSNVARSTRSATPTAVPLFPNDSSDPYVDLCASKQVSRVQETPRRWRGGPLPEALICAPASTRPTRARRAPRASRRTRGPASWSGSRASP